MEANDVIDVARDAIIVMLQVSMPVMMVGLVVSVVIALFQALTQIQEMTLTFVPKIVAIFASLLLFMPYMGRVMDDLMVRIAERIASL
jgi:flagellar biosynthesis protein FliQ